MTVFIVLAALLTLLIVAWLVWPLLRRSNKLGVSIDGLNTAIYRDQLLALDRDLANGAISAQDFAATRDEVQRRLLEDVEGSATDTPLRSPGFWNARRTAAAIVLLFPLASGATYWWLGNPGAMDPVLAQSMSDDKIQQMVDTLAAKLKANPNDPKGWAMLARSYKVMKRFDDAEAAFVKAGDLVNTEPDVMVEYADLLAARAGNSIEGRPLELVNKALSLNPQHPMGLMMSGVAAYRRSEFKLAIEQWEKLLALLEPGSADAQEIQANIDDARAQAGPASGASPLSLKGVGGANGEAGKLPPVDPAAAGPMTADKINQMVERLAARLKENPGDLDGWVKLARAYKVQGRLEDAEKAYAKAGKRVESDPDLLTQYADLLATRAGNKMEGRPLALVDKALKLDPRHPVALMMAGSAAFARADYKTAVKHWETVLTVLEPGSRDATLVQQEIADARAKGGMGLQLQPKP